MAGKSWGDAGVHATRWELVECATPPVRCVFGVKKAESIQRIVVHRALDGSELDSPEAVIAALEATVSGWNRAPTPFVWGGKRHLRRERARARWLGDSGALVRMDSMKGNLHSK